MRFSPYIAGLLCCLIPVAAGAFKLSGFRWEEQETAVDVGIEGQAPSGLAWSTVMADAVAEWDEASAEISFRANSTGTDPCAGFSASDGAGDTAFPAGSGDDRNGAGFSDTLCGNEFGKGVLAVTLSLSFPVQLGFASATQADIVFNTDFDWDIYEGSQPYAIDFRRVALHELGHVLGLGHENLLPAIMAPRIGQLESLQRDDIEGLQAIYEGAPSWTCEVADTRVNSVILGALAEDDCEVLELYGGEIDTSFIDLYRFSLETETRIFMLMESADLDSVVALADSRLTLLNFDDDSAEGCDSLLSGTFPAGEYFLLANTYVNPIKCEGQHTGEYRISLTNDQLPPLSKVTSLAGTSSRSMITGGASSDGGRTFKTRYSDQEAIHVAANIFPDPSHLGEPAAFYMVAMLGTGGIYVKQPHGGFGLYGSLENLPAFRRTSSLSPKEPISIVDGLIGRRHGISNTSFRIFLGYALDSDPENIFYNGQALEFAIE